jgi:uncharacterized protein
MKSGPTPSGEVWIDGRLVVRRSAIEGRGLFFAEDMAADTVLIRLGGRLVTSTELDALIAAADAHPDLPYVDTITIYEDAHLVIPPRTAIHFGNHSCDPTLWHVGPYELATRRDVAGGEEATIDYGTQSGADGFVMDCSCGAGRCRGRVSSEDWRRPELQERYRGHWVPALQACIEAAPGGGTG